MPNYKIVESVGSGVQHVHDYEDIERHHPSRGNERGRVYGTVNGEREELLGNYAGTPTVSRDGDYYVSKDFVLQAGNSSAVKVPAVANGYIGRIDPSDGIVQIYDKPANDPSREMIAQYRHMDLRNTELKVGQQVEYGQPLGIQGGFNNGNPNAFGKHVHIDINTSYLPQMERYVRDMANGAITTDKRPPHQENATGQTQVSNVSGNGRNVHSPGGAGSTTAAAPMADGVLRKDEHGPEVKALQERLNALGYKDAQGHALGTDGKFGKHTKEAVEAFQRANNLEVDGKAGPKTLEALKNAQPAGPQAEQPATTKPGEVQLSNPAHPDNAMYKQAVAGLEKLGPQAGFKDHAALERAAGTLTYEARVSGMTKIDHVVPNASGTGLFAVQGDLRDPASQRVVVDKAQASNQSIEQSTQQLKQDAPTQNQTQEPAPERQQPKTMMA